MKYSLIAATIVALAAPGSVSAQFTTVVSPAPEETIAPPGEPQPVRVDTTRRITLGEMQAWVDSVAIEARTPRDTAGSAADTTALPAPPASGRPEPTPQPTTRFEEGAPAPDTATPLPLLLLLGAGTAGLGAALLRRRDS